MAWTIEEPDYDYGAAEKAGIKPDPKTGHWPDTYKLPNHITFSSDSKYSKPGQEGGQWKQEGGKWHFYPSEYNLTVTPADRMQKYFNDVEKDSVLHLPSKQSYTIEEPPAQSVIGSVGRGLWDRAKAAVGGMETLASQATGMIAAPIGGLAGLTRLGPSPSAPMDWTKPVPESKRGWDQAEETMGKVSGALTYQPMTEYGQAGNEMVQKAMEFLVSDPANIVGNYALMATKSPALAASVKTALELAGYGALFGGPKALAKPKPLEMPRARSKWNPATKTWESPPEGPTALADVLTNLKGANQRDFAKDFNARETVPPDIINAPRALPKSPLQDFTSARTEPLTSPEILTVEQQARVAMVKKALDDGMTVPPMLLDEYLKLGGDIPESRPDVLRQANPRAPYTPTEQPPIGADTEPSPSTPPGSRADMGGGLPEPPPPSSEPPPPAPISGEKKTVIFKGIMKGAKGEDLYWYDEPLTEGPNKGNMTTGLTKDPESVTWSNPEALAKARQGAEIVPEAAGSTQPGADMQEPAPVPQETPQAPKTAWNDLTLGKQIEEAGINQKVESHPVFPVLKDAVNKATGKTPGYFPSDYLTEPTNNPTVRALQDRIAKETGIEFGSMPGGKARWLEIPEPSTYGKSIDREVIDRGKGQKEKGQEEGKAAEVLNPKVGEEQSSPTRTVIHYGRTEREAIRGAQTAGETNSYSKEIRNRIDAGTDFPQYPYTPEINTYDAGVIVRERKVTANRIPHEIEVPMSDIYNGTVDPKGLRVEARRLMTETGSSNPALWRNIFSNLVQKEGYRGYEFSAADSGERMTFLYDTWPAKSPVRTTTSISGQVQGVMAPAMDIGEAIRQGTTDLPIIQKNLEATLKSTFPETTIEGTPTINYYRGGWTEAGEIEPSVSFKLSGPPNSVNAAAAHIGLIHGQNAVMLSSESGAHTGYYVEFPIKPGLEQKILDAAGQRGLKDIQISKTDEGYIFHTYLPKEQIVQQIGGLETLHSDFGHGRLETPSTNASFPSAESGYREAYHKFFGPEEGERRYTEDVKRGEEYKRERGRSADRSETGNGVVSGKSESEGSGGKLVPIERNKSDIQPAQRVESRKVEVTPESQIGEMSEGRAPSPSSSPVDTTSEKPPIPPGSSQGTILYSNPLTPLADFYTQHIGKPAKDWMVGHLPKSVREFWSPTSTLTDHDAYLFARGGAKGYVDRAESFVKTVMQKLDPLSDQSKKDIFNVASGNAPMTGLSVADQRIAKQIISTNDRIGQMLVDRDLISQETFDAHKGQYVHYMYLKHILGDDAHVVSGSGGKIDTSILKQRKDLTQAQRKAIGLIEDISVAEPVGLAKALIDVAMHDFFKTIKDHPDWTWQPPRVQVAGQMWDVGTLSKELEIQKRVVKQNPTPEAQARLNDLETGMQQAQQISGQGSPEGFVKIPDTKSYGPLAGQFVRQEIARDIMPLRARIAEPSNLMGKGANFFLDGAEQAMTLFKVSKTALNIPTGARNIVSNMIQLNMSGMPWYDVPVRTLASLKEMYDQGPLYTQAKRNGLFKTNWAQGEINEAMDTIRKGGNGGFSPFAMAKNLAKYYGKIDDVFKLSKFMDSMENGMGLEKSILEANKWGMDYSLAARSVKAARRFLIPFASYNYKIAPLLAESIIERPWVLAKYAALPFVFMDIAKEQMQLSDRDWKKLQGDLPLWLQRNQSYVPMWWKSPEGNVQWVNMEYFFPAQNMIALYRDVSQGRYGEITGDVGIGNPLLDVYTILKTMKGNEPPRDPYTGKEVFNRLDSPVEKATATTKWLYEKWAPSMLTMQGTMGQGIKAATGTQDKYGKTVTPGQAAASLGGLNIVSPTPVQAVKERQALAFKLRSSLAYIMKDPTLSPEKKTAAVTEYRKQLMELYPRED